ncbi:SpoIIE family protein phosphatase [Maridesulfovibrio hydrothermalis]|uniref:Response regulator receiver modulated serine phosphatase n=1 Tax=Maridesulfovibrio hydrothermalis AM13 = DSM 14728 TaxID=1121451 RepID=L0R8P0_9BACT|nr:SpoIIE family protein phosphatase [Maridesulfovibrio hydrothermalis]CCO23133.1 Response regulator receiver modulated serine phosphatase [Maridesulfovibrio hydrothermalis AM13 = DSM 14728]
MTYAAINEQLLTEHKISVLLIDDQPMVGEAVRRMLEGEEDIDFHFVSDPTQAIPTAESLQPTVILQDLVMPEIDGMTMVKFMRVNSKLKDIPLIVLSTKEEATTKAEAFALGANDYLVKLPDRIELLARIRYHSKGYINLLQRNEAYKQLLESRDEMRKELAVAADYVTSLLPDPMFEGEIKADWRFIPSASLGGDSFGYHWLDDDHFAMYLLDVCDHGVGSALLSVSAMNVLRSQTLPDTDFLKPDNVLVSLNNSFQMDQQNNLYFTMWYGVYCKSERTLTYSSGGHPPALLFNGSETHQLRTPGMIVGGMPDMTYTSDSVTIAPGARFFLYSDGVYELQKVSDGKMWEFDEYTRFMAGTDGPLGTPIDQLIKHTRALQGEEMYEDDFSMVEFVFE